MLKLALVFMLAGVLSACAGVSPNPGETTVDIEWTSGNFDKAYVLVKPYAELGQPWAQLRLGIFYENGWGVEKDNSIAESWYLKASEQLVDDAWAEGQIIGAKGEPGYFNQNSDALIAKFNLARMYLHGNDVGKDVDKSLSLIEEVIIRSGGEPIFFCCESSSPRYFTSKQMLELKAEVLIQKEMKTETYRVK